MIVVAPFSPSMCSGELFTGFTSIFVYILVATFFSLSILLVSTYFHPLLCPLLLQNDINIDHGYGLNIYSSINKGKLNIVGNKKTTRVKMI